MKHADRNSNRFGLLLPAPLHASPTPITLSADATHGDMSAGQLTSLGDGELSTDPEVVLAHLQQDRRMMPFTDSPLDRLMQPPPSLVPPQGNHPPVQLRDTTGAFVRLSPLSSPSPRKG